MVLGVGVTDLVCDTWGVESVRGILVELELDVVVVVPPFKF